MFRPNYTIYGDLAIKGVSDIIIDCLKRNNIKYEIIFKSVFVVDIDDSDLSMIMLSLSGMTEIIKENIFK